jgi:hypothetical protein
MILHEIIKNRQFSHLPITLPFLSILGLTTGSFTKSWTFIMGILFMAAILGFRGGIIGILRNKLRFTI